MRPADNIVLSIQRPIPEAYFSGITTPEGKIAAVRIFFREEKLLSAFFENDFMSTLLSAELFNKKVWNDCVRHVTALNAYQEKVSDDADGVAHVAVYTNTLKRAATMYLLTNTVTADVLRLLNDHKKKCEELESSVLIPTLTESAAVPRTATRAADRRSPSALFFDLPPELDGASEDDMEKPFSPYSH